MPLEELNESVYKRDFRSNVPGSADTVDPLPGVSSHTHERPKGNNWSDTPVTALTPEQIHEQEKRRQGKHRRLVLLLAAVLLALLAMGGFFGKRFFLFDPTNLSLELSGPEVVKTGDTLEITLRYQNRNWSGVTGAEITLNFPESFRPNPTPGWEMALSRATYKIGTIAGRGSGEITLVGTLQAFEKKTAFFKGALRSSPSGITNPTEVVSQWTVLVDASALALEVNGPPSLVLGQAFEYVVKYQNESTETIENLRLVAEYPDGFIPTETTPKPNRGEDTWIVGRLEPGASGTVQIKGEIRGSEGDARRLVMRLGKELGDGNFLSLAQQEKVTRVLSPPLLVSLTMNNQAKPIIRPGDELSGKVNFENTGTVGIRDIIAYVTLDTSLVDIETLKFPSGAIYNRQSQQIIFKASEIPSLRLLNPKERGQLTFSFGLRPDLANLGKKDIEVKTTVLLDSPDLPHGQNTEAFAPKSESVAKIASSAQVNVFIEPVDSAVPLRIGESKQYTVRMTFNTTLNTLTETNLELFFPGIVQSINPVSAHERPYRYNERTGELIWDPGNIEPVSGKELIFQVTAVPSIGSSGRPITLINSGRFQALDAFTNEKIEILIKPQMSENVSS